MLKGFLDRCDNTVAGWALDTENLERSVAIRITVDGEVVSSTEASLHRADLDTVFGSSHHGFSIDLPAFSKTVKVLVHALHGSGELLLGERVVTLKPMVEHGQDGWLFLVNDSNNTDLLITGQRDELAANLLPCATLMSVRAMTLNAMGIAYQTVIMPEKNVVCNALRETPLAISDDRPVPQLIKLLSLMSYSSVLYPIELFKKEAQRAFCRTDTHASGYGYQLILNELGRYLPQYYKNAEVLLEENADFSGDLAMHLHPKPTEPTQQLIPFDCTNTTSYYNEPAEALASGQSLHNKIVRIKKSRGIHKRLVVFGTSSAYYGLPAFSVPFEDTFFVWTNTIDFNLIRMLKPSCVLWISTERCLPIVANDYVGLPDVRTVVQT